MTNGIAGGVGAQVDDKKIDEDFWYGVNKTRCGVGNKASPELLGHN